MPKDIRVADPSASLFGGLTDEQGVPWTERLTSASDKRGTLTKRFGVPPFSVLDARQGYWQERKREWIAFGIRGEEGRHATESANAICAGKWNRGAQSEFYEPSPTGKPIDAVPGGGGPNSIRRRAANDVSYKKPGEGSHGLLGMSDSSARIAGGYHDEEGNVKGTAGTSIFDPVLCELVYKWFTPPGGRILDPFAGESTKGIIASYLGYQYTGVELRQEQVDANNRQAATFAQSVREKTGEEMPLPVWHCGDSSNLGAVLDDADPFADQYDFIWTSPPYYDLEIYSKDEKDGSAFETYEKFIAWYKEIFGQAVARLRDNRFLAVKVGEIRDDQPGGVYRDFEFDNIRVFRELGLLHYNRIVLVTAVGSLPVRVGNKFQKNRKVGNTHQMIYVFWKGDRKALRSVHEHLGEIPKGDVGEALDQGTGGVPLPPQEAK